MERLLFECAFRAVLLAVATQIAVRALRIHTAAGRHTAWTIALVAMLLMPAWISWGPETPLPVGSPLVVQSLRPQTRQIVHVPAADDATHADAVVAAAIAAPAADRRLTWPTILWSLYGAGVLLLLARLAVGTWRTRRLIESAVPTLAHLASPACITPITVGWIRPVTILPLHWNTWSGAQLNAVLAHEQEHVRRRDPLVQWFALFNRAVFWFHPLAWWLERRLAALAEEACDSAVLRRGHHPVEYCGYLLSIARSAMNAGSRVRFVGAAMPGQFLSRRIRRILHSRPELPLPRRRIVCLVIACALSSALLTAGTIAPSTAPSRPSAGAGMSPAAATSTDALPEYWFDDDEWHLEVASIISAQELEQYRALRTTGEREAFMAAFWQRRDATPNTASNEFRQEFERRIAYAKENFRNPESAATFGYQTDRGRWYVMFGAPASIGRDSSSAEEWRYASLDALGSRVAVRFYPQPFFGCSYRGGRYRIVSPAPLKRFEGGGPTALTYPGGFVYLAFPIDPKAITLQWGLRTRSGAETVVGQSQDRPIDFVQGQIGDPGEPILRHIDGTRLFEPNGIACTEQLPPDEYTLWVEAGLVGGGTRRDTVTFTVD